MSFQFQNILICASFACTHMYSLASYVLIVQIDTRDKLIYTERRLYRYASSQLRIAIFQFCFTSRAVHRQASSESGNVLFSNPGQNWPNSLTRIGHCRMQPPESDFSFKNVLEDGHGHFRATNYLTGLTLQTLEVNKHAFFIS